jgi:Protein of unknown function (DUF2867)
MSTATPCEFPSTSALRHLLPGAYFFDAYRMEVPDPAHTAMAYFLKTAARTPAWVNGLMALRNRVVAWVGLKNLGSISALDPYKQEQDYRPGDRVGIFTLRSSQPDEVVVFDSDKHLEVNLSVCRLPRVVGQPQVIVVSTVVHVHNLLGRLYMLPVTPLHRRIVPAVMARLAVVDGGHQR